MPTRLKNAQHFFQHWSDEMAYVTGLLFADGSIPLRKGKPAMVVLELKDTGHVEKVASVIDPALRVYQHTRTDGRVTAKFSIGVKSVIADCMALGLTPQKSLTVSWPNMPDALVRHFVRGYFDGNGTVAARGNGAQLSFSTGSRVFADQLAATLRRFTGIDARVYRPYNRHSNVTILGAHDVRRFGEWMYDNTALYLERKHVAWSKATAIYASSQPRYKTILIDPPWQFQVWGKDTGQGRSAEAHYPTMTLDELKALPLPSLMADDCAVFMWATWPTLPEALALGQAWGLTYKTCAFNWVKLNKMQTDQPFTGMGYWTRANSEPCLLFTKGSPARRRKDVPQIVLEWTGGMFDRLETETLATPIQAHSQKPNAIYDRIEALVDGPYLECFARRSWRGWDRWGNEVESTVVLTVAA